RRDPECARTGDRRPALRSTALCGQSHDADRTQAVNRLLALFGPLPFLALAIVAMGLSIGMGVCVYDALSPLLAPLASWLRYPLTGSCLHCATSRNGSCLLSSRPPPN